MRTEETTKGRVQAIIAERIGVPVESVTDDANLVEDLGADSLDMVELSIALEEEFDIELEDEVVQGIRTVADAVKVVTDASK